MKRERVTLRFSPDAYDKAITYHLVRDYGLVVNILRAEITPGQQGNLLLDLEGEPADITAALAYLSAEGIKVTPSERQIVIDKGSCVDCGACTAVCFSQALSIRAPEWDLAFNADRCIACGLCLSACPVRAIHSKFSDPIEETPGDES